MAKSSRSDKILSQVRRRLKHVELEWTPQAYLDTGNPMLNNVLGHPDLGIPYGRVMEVSGMESHGKTALVTTLAAIAQQQGAYVVWIDFENSYDPEWVKKRGLDTENDFLLFQPYEGMFGNEKSPRIISGNELCDEVEDALPLIHKHANRIVLVVDSVPAILLTEEADSDVADRNLRTNMALPMFLGALLRRWISKARNYNILLIFINQLRQNPMQLFGSPYYTPGGNALKFYSHCRVRVQRTKGGRVMHMGKQVGIQGVMTNIKNKAGGLEGSQIGYRILFDGPTEFLDPKEIKKSQ